MVQLGYEPIRIDILTSVDGLTFEQAYANRKLVQHEGLEISLLGVNDLIRNKEAVGRKKDLGDIELLQRTQKKRNKEKKKRR